MTAQKPPSPFPGVSPSIFDESLGGYSWFCQPPGVINRFCAGIEMGLDHAAYITQRVDSAMMRAFPDQKYVYIHDFSAAAGYTSQARQAVTEWGKTRQKQGCVELVVIIPPKMSSFFLMATNTAALGLRLVGMNVEVAESLEGVLERLKLRPYAPPKS